MNYFPLNIYLIFIFYLLKEKRIISFKNPFSMNYLLFLFVTVTFEMGFFLLDESKFFSFVISIVGLSFIFINDGIISYFIKVLDSSVDLLLFLIFY